MQNGCITQKKTSLIVTIFGKQLSQCHWINNKQWEYGIVENEKVLSCDDGIFKTLNSFFSDVIRLLRISHTDYRIYLDEIQDNYFGKWQKK